MNNEIASVGELVKYTGETPYNWKYFGLDTAKLMEEYLIPGNFYEVTNVDLGYNKEEGNDWYQIKCEYPYYWFPCSSFDRNCGLIYGLK